MIDQRARAALAPVVDRTAAVLDRWGAGPTALTVAGLVVGVAACVAAGLALWPLALALWLGNRILDGLDGAVARRRGPTELGGFLDLVSDFAVYGGFVVGVAVAVPDARLACTVLLATYYVSGAALLAWSSVAERRRLTGDGRSIVFTGGLAEGAETVVVYVLFCLLPGQAALIAWGFAGMVAVTAVQRVTGAVRTLRTP